MANFEALNDDVLEEAAGGRATENTTDWTGAHWRPTGHVPGSTWTEFGHNWYLVKAGDTLSGIAQRLGYTVQHLKTCNPKTITDINKIYAGDALSLGQGHL